MNYAKLLGKLWKTAIIICFISVCVGCVSYNNPSAMTNEDQIITEPGDIVNDSETTRPGCWYSDRMLLEQFEILLDRRLK